MTKPDDPTAESQPPKDDGNFLHVVIYAGIFLILAFIAAFIVLKGVGRRIVPGKHDPHPTSQLMLPPVSSSIAAAQKAAIESSFIFEQQINKTRV
jgi:hypothetical protein